MATTFVDRETVISASWLNAADSVISNAFIIELSGITNTLQRNAYFTSAVSVFTALASGAVPASGGGTDNFLRADGTFAPPSAASGSSINYAVNGGMIVGQRAPAAISATLGYGKVDRMKAKLTGTPSAGTITQTTTASVGFTGYGLRVNQATNGSDGLLEIATFIEGRDAVNFKNGVGSFGLRMYHNIGTGRTATVVISKADSFNDFSSVTAIDTSAAIAVANATDVLVAFENVDMGDCSNGIKVSFLLDVGTITLKDFEFTELSAVAASALPTSYSRQSFSVEFAKCLRYFVKSFPYATEPAASASLDGAVLYAAQIADAASYVTSFTFGQPMPVDPVVAFYSPEGASGKWLNKTQSTDSGTPAAAWAVAMAGGLYILNPQASGDNVGDILGVHFTADGDF